MNDQPTNELQLPEKKVGAVGDLMLPEGGGGITLRSWNDLWQFSGAVFHSGMAPKNMKQPQIAIAMQAGMELGFSALQSIRIMPVVHGRPSLEGSAMLALVIRAGVCKEEPDCGTKGEGDERIGWCRSWKHGWSAPRVSEFTWKEAVDAGLTSPRGQNNAKSIYVLYGKAMLKWKAVGIHCKQYYPDILLGISTEMDSEEIGGPQPMRDITPTPGDGSKAPNDFVFAHPEHGENPVSPLLEIAGEVTGLQPVPEPEGHGELIEEELTPTTEEPDVLPPEDLPGPGEEGGGDVNEPIAAEAPPADDPFRNTAFTE